jgi:hypothetical protein
MSDLPLTDDQLRQVAAHMAAEYGHDQTNDRMGIGEMLDGVLAEYDIELPAALNVDGAGWDADVYEAILDRIADLIRDATITVEWPPDTAVRAFAAMLRAELEKLREAHERRGLFEAALAYVGAVASLDAAVADLDAETTEGADA